MTAALEGGEWSAARRGRTLPPGKTRYTFYRRVSGPQGRSGRAENLVPTGIRFRTVQPVVSRYTDCATRLTLFNGYQDSFLAEKLPGHEIHHSSSASVEIKNVWSYTCTPPTCLHGVDKESFTLNT